MTASRVFAPAVAILFALVSTASFASPPAAAADVALQAGECVPGCQAGFVCAQGRCVSACNPPCPDGQQCRSDGECVSAMTAPPPMPPPEAACVPSCRSGYTCVGGQCMSACNPPCAQGEKCSANGECVGTQAPPSAGDYYRRTRGFTPTHWARPAGVTGIVTSILVVIMGGLSIAIDSTGVSVGTGALALLAAGIGGPIVAVGAASARFDESISGAPGTRVVGWIGYTLAMIAGAAMVIMGIYGSTPTPAAVATVLLGASSLLCLTIDAFSSAGEADEFIQRTSAARPARVAPVVSLARLPDGSMTPTVGVAMAW